MRELEEQLYDGEVRPATRNDPRTQIVSRIEPGSRVLEVGCATGFVSRFLMDRLGCTVVGLEIEPEAADLAEARGVQVIRGSVEDPAVRSRIEGTFDYLICGDVLEHLRDPGGVLESLLPYLAPDGHVLASIPNVAHWSIRWRLLIGRFDYTRGGLLDANHLRFFTLRTAAEMFRSLGLEPEVGCVYRFPRFTPLPEGIRAQLARWRPNLFGYQLIVDATRRG